MNYLFITSFVLGVAVINAQSPAPLTGNPSRPVAYDTSVVIAAPFESFDVPKGVHPRLYFRSEDVPGLRKKAASTGTMSSMYYERIIRSANNADYYSNSVRPVPKTVNGNNQDWNVVESAIHRALLYRLDPMANKEKGREAIVMANNYLRTWRNGENFDFYGRGGQAAKVLHDFSLIYDWCHDLMTPKERLELIGEIKFRDVNRGVHAGNDTNEPNNLSTGLMKALTMFEFSTSQDTTNVFQGWEHSFKIASAVALNGHHLEASIPAITAFAIAVYDEQPAIWQLVSTWLYDNVFPSSNFLMEAGMPWQGASYGSARIVHLVHANLLIYQMIAPEKRKSCFTPNVVDVAHSFIYYRRPDGQYVRMGNNFVTSRPFGVPHLAIEQSMFLFINKIFRDPYIQKELTYVRQHRDVQSVLGFLLWDDQLCPARSYVSLPTAYYSPYPNGEIVHQTKWVDEIDFNSNAMHVNMKIGDLRTWNHEHMDAGGFQIYYKGGLAVDAGIYEGSDVGQGDGFGSAPEAGWNRSTNSHNAFLIRDPKMDEKTAETSHPREQHFVFRGRALANGGGQYLTWQGGWGAPVNLYRVNGIPYYFTPNPDAETSPIRGKIIPGKGPIEGHIPTAEVLSHAIAEGLKPSYSYLKGEMAELYGYRAEEAKRSFLCLDFNDETYPGALIVFDRITSGNSWGDGANYEKYWLLHSMNEPTVIRDKDGFIDGFLVQRTEQVAPSLKYNGQLFTTPLLPAKDNLNYELVVGHYVFGQPYKQGRGTQITEEDGQYMIMTSPKKKRLTDLMLNVMQVSDPGIKPLPVTLIGKETDVMVGAKIFNCVAMFSTNGRLLNATVILPVTGKDDVLKYHIADLAEGVWSVVDEKGNRVALMNVSAEGNIGTFTAQASNVYKLIINYIPQPPSKGEFLTSPNPLQRGSS